MIRLLSLLAALTFSLSAFGGDLAQARILVDQKRYAEAIAIYETLVSVPPGQADLLIEAARVNAWGDRHPSSARLYRQALDAAPDRRYDVLLPLAWQLAWGNCHDEAIPLFREVANQVPAQKNEALHGLAESLAARNKIGRAHV